VLGRSAIPSISWAGYPAQLVEVDGHRLGSATPLAVASWTMRAGPWSRSPTTTRVSPATRDEHQADTFGEHGFMNVLSP
jgi:hypothetical protein